MAEWPELWEYVTAAVDILRTRATSDSDPAVREAATKALVSAIHPFLDRDAVREPFFDALAQLPSDGRRQVWTEVNHLRALFDRVETPEFIEMTKSEPDTTARRSGLDLLTERLPASDASDELSVLAAARRWEWEDGELQQRIVAAAQALPADRRTDALLQLSAAEPPPEAASRLALPYTPLPRAMTPSSNWLLWLTPRTLPQSRDTSTPSSTTTIRTPSTSSSMVQSEPG